MIHGVEHEALVSFVSNLVGRDDAEDVVSETYLAALSGADTYRSDAKARTWVYGIAKHKAQQWLEKRTKRRAAEAYATPAAPSTSPEWGVLLRDLSDEDRALVEAVQETGSRFAAAKRLGLTPGQVYYRWQRLAKRVR